MTDYRIVKMWHQDELFTPLVDAAGRLLDQAQAEDLARAPGWLGGAPGAFGCVVGDESMPIQPGVSPWSLARWRPPTRPIYVLLGDSGLKVGVVEALELRPRGALPNTTGRSLFARVKLDQSILGEVVHAAILAGVLEGVCGEVVGAADCPPGRLGVEAVVALRLGARESACLRPACVQWVSEPPGGGADRASPGACGCRGWEEDAAP